MSREKKRIEMINVLFAQSYFFTYFAASSVFLAPFFPSSTPSFPTFSAAWPVFFAASLGYKKFDAFQGVHVFRKPNKFVVWTQSFADK